MENNSKKTSFERMNEAVREMVKEDLEVEVTSCKPHHSCTLKVVAIPEAVNTVEVYVPYQIFVGAKTNDVCAEWGVNFWKMGLRQLCFEFGVKDCPRTRLMTRRAAGVSPRVYADFFWKKIESMDGWNIVLPEIAKNDATEADGVKTVAQVAESKDETGNVKNKPEVLKSFEMMGLKFCCM